MVDLKPEDFRILFNTSAQLHCIHTEFLLRSPLNVADIVLVCEKNYWRPFISLEGEKRCQAAGLKFFGDKDAYATYSSDFRAMMKRVREEIASRFRKPDPKLSREEALSWIKIFQEFWDFYDYTEWPFQDLAYAQAQKSGDPLFKRNVEDVGKIKYEGREILNLFVFEGGILQNFLRSIGIQFLNESTDTYFMYIEELLALYDGTKPEHKIIEERRRVYGAVTLNGAFRPLDFEEAQEIQSVFCKPAAAVDSFGGTVVSRGYARGRVVIALSLTDVKKIAEIDARMQKGDILVAETTSPDMMMLCKKAAAIVANQGGMLSHAAVVSRELGIPGIIGTRIATHVLKDGDMVEVDAEKGIVRVLKRA